MGSTNEWCYQTNKSSHQIALKKPETIRSKIGANQREQHQNSALLNDKETLPIWAGEKISFDKGVA